MKASQKKLTEDRSANALIYEQNEVDTPHLPVPQIKELYQLDPKILEAVFEATNKESEHRREMERYYMTRTYRIITMGQIFGFIIGLCGVVGGVYTAVQGQPVAGGTIATLSMGTLAVAFLGKGSQKK